MFRANAPASSESLGHRDRAIADAVSLAFMAGIASLAAGTGVPYILFPEMAALAHDVLTRPWGKWASQPMRLIVTPTATAVIGTLVTRHAPYNLLTILLIVCMSIATVAALRSAIAPAISAGLLPLVLGVQSWLYPLCIVGGLVVLVAILFLWKQRYLREHPRQSEQLAVDVDDVLEAAPRGRFWLVGVLVFVTITGTVAWWTGLRFILFPPLVVIAYEMFGHPETCPWAKRPLLFPVACFLAASGGFAACHYLGAGALAAGLGMAWGVIVLRSFDIHMPPALAVALIPLVMDHPTWKYPASVAIGTSTLTAMFLLFRRSTTVTVGTNTAIPATESESARPVPGGSPEPVAGLAGPASEARHGSGVSPSL